MPVRIDALETEIEVQGDSAPESTGTQNAAPAWKALEDLRRLRDRQRRDEARTRAWDHDD